MSAEAPIPYSEYMPSEGLTIEEDKELTRLLSKQNGRFSPQAYTEIAKKTPQDIIEVVVLRNNNGVIETLLIPRPDGDPVWPGMMHTPGSALRNNDVRRADGIPYNGPFERIQNEELGTNFAYEPVMIGIDVREGKRGVEDAKIFITELDDDSQIKPGHEWYPVDKLPENPRFIDHQLNHVKMAADYFILKDRV